MIARSVGLGADVVCSFAGAVGINEGTVGYFVTYSKPLLRER